MGLLDRWLDELSTAEALIGDRNATAARLEGWIPLLEAAVAGDEAALAELLRIVALDARNLAQEGRPASTVIAQPLLLSGAWPEPAALTLSQLLVRVTADAHALGCAEAKESRQRALLARHLPVLPVGRGWLGFLVGPLGSDVIDGVFGRLLTAAAGTASSEIAVDIAGAEAPGGLGALFLRTLEGFATADTGPVERLVVTGAPAGAMTEALADRRVSPERVTVGRLNDWLSPAP